MQRMTDLIALGMPGEIGGLDPRKASLTSIAKNAQSLLSDAELLFDHGRYARAAALAVLAVEEVGKFFLLQRNTAEAEQAMRDHMQKQRIVAVSVGMEAAFDAYERALHSLGLEWKPIEDVTTLQMKNGSTAKVGGTISPKD